MNKLTVEEVHSFLIGVSNGFCNTQFTLGEDCQWVHTEYHYFAVGQMIGTILPYAIALGIGIIIGVLI